MQIVNLFYELARQHLHIKGFRYGKAYEKGAGSDVYPLAWLDDPLNGQSLNDATIRHIVSVDFLGIPKNDADVLAVQSAAYLAGLSFKERIRELKNETKINVEGFGYITLRNYYDDNAAGCRFTYTLVGKNPINRCTEYFDPAKQLEVGKPLPDFNTENPNGCAVFNDKKGLPNFKI